MIAERVALSSCLKLKTKTMSNTKPDLLGTLTILVATYGHLMSPAHQQLADETMVCEAEG